MSWQNLIQQQAVAFPNESQPALTPLADLSIIIVSGDDAESFLQNLLTNDVNALKPHQAQLNGLCSPKGRLLAIFQLIKREQDYLIVLPAELAEAIAQRLTMFKLRSKVDIALSDSLAAVGIINPDNKMTDLPSITMQGRDTELGLLIKQAGQSPRFLAICEKDKMLLLSEWLTNGWQLTTQAFWQLLDIEAGVPAIFNDSKEQFTPQQVNLELVGGVSFKKGCYPGQEVVARLHYLGSPNRRMFLAKVGSGELPQANTPVSDEDDNILGHVVQAQTAHDNTLLCQVSMKLSAITTKAYIGDNAVTELTALVNDEG
ncbi:Folate-dependent protein for Fe/S cluster synthesis/repair in oxidative stress [Methylophaga thiooxydans]|uniref:Folate-dependent protein for Fe/S cluster synthesis/repair in oxidative stress n=1 Tax=Methylophaga thiooxydans TaxID=392484 RepID=A0A0A0BEB3_9GAMM|nr:folate-binding protein YgfZ [Methylophaga thiooxydans]KGM06042.1 Folate-dependent protein for Fe/S cluster synthesis/repair in oxidative stress [Methylophaga thiooxydans]